MFCAAAIALLAVSSCGKIWDEFDSVHGEIDNLKAKVEALEKKLNDEVATLNTKIGALETAYKAADAELLKKLTDGDAALAASLETLSGELDALDGVVDGYITSNDAALKAAIEEYKKADEALKAVDTEVLAALAGVNVINVAKNEAGDVVITFADKSTVTVPANPATGIVTVVDGQWAVVVNGEVTPLEAEVNPDTKLAFKVVENVLNVSYDGGETWVPTGAVVNDDTTINVVEGFEYNEGDPYLTLTVGGKEYTLPVYKADNSSLVLGRTDYFIMYGAKKSVELKAEGVAEYYVMSKPDGWKANFEGSTLYVVAPAKKVFEMGAAEAEGEVLVHATTDEGKCKVVKLNVETGDGLTLDIDGNGNVVIKNAYTQMVSSEMGEPTEAFANFYFGFATSMLLDNPEEFFGVLAEWYETPDWSPYGMLYNLSSFMPRQFSFVPIENEVDVIETTLDAIYKEVNYDELPYGESFVFWIAPVDEKGVVIADAAVYYPYTHLRHEVEIIDVTHNDATLSFHVEGATRYVVNVIDPWFEANGFTIKEYMEQMGEWMYLTQGYIDYLPLFDAGDYTGENAMKMSDILYTPLNFDSKYYCVVFPYMEGVSYTDYETQFAPYVYEFKTKALESGADYVAAVGEAEVTYTSVSVPVTPQENTVVWYTWYSKEDYELFGSDSEVLDDILGAEWPQTLDYDAYIKETGLESGDEVVLAMVSVGADGKYGDLVVKEYKTKSVPSVLDEDLTVTVGTETATYNSITVNVTPAANTVVYYNFYSEAMLNNWETDAEAASYTIQNARGILNTAVDVTASNLSQGQTQVLVLVILDNNNPDTYNIVKKTFKSKSYPYSESITVALNDMTYDSTAKTGTAVFDVTGDVTEVIFGCYYGGYTYNFESDVVTKGQVSSYFKPQTASVVDGKVSFEFSASADWYEVYVTAVVKKDGTVTALANKTYNSSIKNAIASLE